MNARTASPVDPGLESALEPLLGRWLGADARVMTVRREPYPYGSSHALEAVDVELANGRVVSLLLKGTGRGRFTRAPFVDDPRREEDVYRQILDPCGVSAPGFVGTVVLPSTEPDTGIGTDTPWLVLERLDGLELYQSGDFEVWLNAARWLARLHARFTPQGDAEALVSDEARCLRQATRLLNRDAEFHRRWWQRATDLTGARADQDASTALRSVQSRFDLAVERTQTLPATFIHGEFYAANVLVAAGPDGPEICPVDWEMAASGPGLLDLAALTSGHWSRAEREAMSEAYRDALPTRLKMPREDFREALDDCAILLAVQWLGWATDWTPPAEQAHDWLSELLSHARRTPHDDPNFVAPTGN